MGPIYTFTKKIKDQIINRKIILDNKDINKISDIISKLLLLHGTTTQKLNEIGLRTNPKTWITTILREGMSDDLSSMMDNLIFDFTDSMMTRMREDSKYALGLVLDNQIILCHSIYGEDTITPEWQILPRMLDVDNILRFVSFNLDQGELLVSFWEKEATSSFMDWLGLTRKQAFLFGGKYRVCSEIDDFHIEFQLSEKEIEDLITNHPEFSQGKININRTIQYFEIDEIRVSRKGYKNIGDFIQDYKAEKFGVPKYQLAYSEIKDKNLPLLTKYFDEKNQIVRIEGEEIYSEVTKDSAPFIILFCDGEIEVRNSFLDELVSRYINNEELKIFHAGMKFNSEPEKVCGLEVFNPLSIDEVARIINEYYQSIKNQDQFIDTILKYIALVLLARNLKNKPLDYIFNQLSNRLISEIKPQKKINITEDNFIEFKSRDFLNDKDAVITTKIVDDVLEKLKHSNFKIYLIGVEDDGTIDPILSSRFNSDRIETIRKSIVSRLSLVTISLKPIYFENKMIFLLIIHRVSND